MAQNQNPIQPQPFDVHDPNIVLMKFAQLRQALRQLDDDITGLIYISISQIQVEQKAAEEERKKKADEEKKPKKNEPKTT